MEPLLLHEDRYFDPEPRVRALARALYEEVRELPIVSPHGHVDPALLAADAPFPDPAALLITPDHYLVRMLYSQGVPLEALGIAPLAGGGAEADPRRIWQTFADHFYLFAGTPSAAWLAYELYELFGVREKLNSSSAQRVYDVVAARLAEPGFRPRALFERFRIEVLATTDAATDPLEHHRALRASGWPGRVIPTFRPDALLAPAAPGWRAEAVRLAELTGEDTGTYTGFVRGLEARRVFFREMGAVATDHGAATPCTHRLPAAQVERLYARAREGRADAADEAAFQAHMLFEMARMSTEDGLVMQLHAGSYRNHNPRLYARYGPDRGADIPMVAEFTRNLKPLLDAFGNDPRLTLVLFTLDESTYSRELAPLAGHYPALRLGPPWWFHDSIEGMIRYRQQVVETAGIYNTAGFNDDTRAFPSIPARHDLARRVDANWLAGLVARHRLDLSDARHLARLLAGDLARRTYHLQAPPREGPAHKK